MLLLNADSRSIGSVVQSYPQSVPDHVLLCYKRCHSPGQCVLQGHQSSQVIPITWVVPGTGPQQPQPRPPAELPEVDEHGVGHQTQWQRAALSQQSCPQALNEVDCSSVHRQRPQAAVTWQPSVLGAAPVTHSGEGHLTEAAVQRVHTQTSCSGERTTRDALMWLCEGFVFTASPWHSGEFYKPCLQQSTKTHMMGHFLAFKELSEDLESLEWKELQAFESHYFKMILHLAKI